MSFRKLALILLETALLLAVVVVLANLRGLLQIATGAADVDQMPWIDVAVRALVIVGTFQVTFFFNDLYESRVIRSKHQCSIRLLESCFYTVLLLILVYVAFDGLDRFVLRLSEPDAGLARFKTSGVQIVVLSVVVLATAYWYRRGVGLAPLKTPFTDRLVFIGDGPMSKILEDELKSRGEPDALVVGYILPNWTGEEREVDGKRVLGGYGKIVEIVRKHAITRVIVALQERRGNLPVLELLNCRLKGVRVEEGELVYERITGKIAIGKLRPSYLIFSEGFNRSKFNYIFKRALDVLLALFGIVVSAPIALVTAILIKLDSRGPVLFSQARVGKEGRIFTLYKFRSMRVDAEKDSGPVWADKDDPRVTRVGRLIRKCRIDELPQLVNVLKNQMSFVGPRPERPFFVEELKREIPYYMERLVVKPGVTGWAQINYRYGASKDDALEKLQFDLYYIKNMSIFLDIIILFRTVKVVLLGFGAR